MKGDFDDRFFLLQKMIPFFAALKNVAGPERTTFLVELAAQNAAFLFLQDAPTRVFSRG
jgi:hypothetical protein